MNSKVSRSVFFMALMWAFSCAGLAASQSDATRLGGLQRLYFADRGILAGEGVIDLEVPARAEDGAVVPVRITAGFPQSQEHYIKTITLLIDKNPSPLAGRFHFTPKSGRADLALRIRVDAYSPVRAVAETNDGKLYMVSRYVKATGGCSAPVGTDLDAAAKRLGKMRFKTKGAMSADQPIQTQLAISHPNLTGLQKDQVSLLFIPAHFVQTIVVKFEGEPVFTAETSISISENPNCRFYFIPEKEGELKAEIKDSKGMLFTKTYAYKPTQPEYSAKKTAQPPRTPSEVTNQGRSN